MPTSVDEADCLPQSRVAGIWARIYRKAGFNSPNEKEKNDVRAAVYSYCLKNGTSREGAFSGDLHLNGGQVVPASIIPVCVGKMEIRKFFRSNMEESYDYFVESGYAETQPRLIAKAAKYGVAAPEAFAMADWLTDCAKFTPAQSEAHERVFQHSVERARRARDGRKLEDVEDARLDKALEAQGPMESTSSGRPIVF